jgi:hypothetical protein
MEIHSYHGSVNPLWNSTAMVRVHSYGIPQPWCAFTAMEFRSHGARSQLWNSAAMVRVHSYGIPELVQTDNGAEFTQRFPSCRRLQSAPEPSRFTHISCITALSDRQQWYGPGRVSAHDLRFSHLVQKTPSALVAGSLAPHEKFHSLKLAKFA